MKTLQEVLRGTLRHLLFASCIAGAAVVSCTHADRETTLPPDEGNGLPVLISASVANDLAITTRAAANLETIQNGWFSLVYPEREGNAVAVCPFIDGSGQIAYKYSGSAEAFTITPRQKTLKPNGLYELDLPTFRFTMDNVIAYEGDGQIADPIDPTSNPGHIVFTPALKTRFSARLENHTDGQFPGSKDASNISTDNDLVWGYAYNREAGNDITLDEHLQTLNFQLTHRMARLSVVLLDDVPVDEAETAHQNFKDEVEANGLDIWITNIVSEPESFDRATGTVNLPEDEKSVYEAYYLWKHDEMGAITATEDEDLSKEETDKANEGLSPAASEQKDIKCYRSKNLILPPDEHVGQRIGNDRPVLCISYQGTVYSGVLPSSMTVISSGESGETQASRSLAFSAGMHLMLRVRLIIDNANPTIRFEPVQLIDWFDFGTYMVRGQEAGISKPEDLKELISLYNGLDTDDKETRDDNLRTIFRKYAGPCNQEKWSGNASGFPEWDTDNPWCIHIYCNIDTQTDLGGTRFSRRLFDMYPFTINCHGWRIDRYTYKFDKYWGRILYDVTNDSPVSDKNGGNATQNYPEEEDPTELPKILIDGDKDISSFPTDNLDDVEPPLTYSLFQS